MKVFQELRILGESEVLQQTVDLITNLLNGNWRRDKQAETEFGSAAGGQTYFFIRDATDKLPGARLALHRRSPNELYVSNVVPIGKRRLDHNEYNGILQEFFSAFVRPVEQQIDVTAVLTEEDLELQDWVSPDTADLLHQFSIHANRSASATHPSDRERWLRFVVSAHHEGSRLDYEILRRWLEEEEGWPEEEAADLARDYERARDVLAFAGC